MRAATHMAAFVMGAWFGLAVMAMLSAARETGHCPDANGTCPDSVQEGGMPPWMPPF